MGILTAPSSAARTALIYITAGALTDVWSGIWFWYLRNNPPANSSTWYWCYGFLCTGLVLLLIGLGVGKIGRAARHAELPPPEVTGAVAKATQTAAARTPVIAPVPTVSPGVELVPPAPPTSPVATVR
jgi:hypothetical protein